MFKQIAEDISDPSHKRLPHLEVLLITLLGGGSSVIYRTSAPQVDALRLSHVALFAPILSSSGENSQISLWALAGVGVCGQLPPDRSSLLRSRAWMELSVLGREGLRWAE